ncbi:MAG TPA: hypothetical protein VFR06_01725, partial [Gallionellaceae bacterium]|nr:hypothetical protein [Gallionellaceae bacterium]
MLATRTLSVNIDCPPGVVYAFVVNPQNLPQWAGGLCQSVTQTDKGWIAHAPQGDMRFRFAEKNALGVLDHYVVPPQGDEVYVPMRVL